MNETDGMKLATVISLFVILGYALAAIFIYEENVVVKLVMLWSFGFVIFRIFTINTEDE